MSPGKRIIIRILKRLLPPALEHRLWDGLVQVRSLGWELRSLIPLRILRKLPGTSLQFGPPRGMAETFHRSSGVLSIVPVFHEAPHEVKATPADLSCPPDELFLQTRKAPGMSVCVALLGNARVLGSKGAIIDRHDQLIIEASREIGRCYSPETALRHSVFGRVKLPPVTKLTGLTASLVGGGFDNYYHWWHEILPRLDLFSKAGIEIHAVNHWLVPKHLRSFHRESLEMLRIPSDRLFYCDTDTHVQTEKLVCVSSALCTGAPPPWLIDFLRSTAIAQTAGPSKETPAKIYLTRQSSTFRRLINETEVLHALQRRGFTPVTCDEFSQQEQMRLFRQAEFVVAPHGAALANLAFCQPGTKIIELLPGNYLQRLYGEIARAAGLHYGAVLDVSQKQSHEGNMLADMRISLSDLEHLLDRMENLDLSFPMDTNASRACSA